MFTFTNYLIFRGVKLIYSLQYILHIMTRTKKFNEESVVIAFRVPKSKAEYIKKAFQKIIDEKYKKVRI